MSVSFLAFVAIVIVGISSVCVDDDVVVGVVFVVVSFVLGFFASFWLDSFVLGFVLASLVLLPFCNVCKSFLSCPILRSLVLISSSCKKNKTYKNKWKRIQKINIYA